MNMLSAAWLLHNGPTPESIKQRVVTLSAQEKHENSLQTVFDACRGYNSTITMIAERLDWTPAKTRKYVLKLRREGRLVSWRIGHAYWYSVTKKELAA